MELIELGIESAKLARLCALREKGMVQLAPSIFLLRGDFFSQCAFFLCAEESHSRPLICAWRICSRDNPAAGGQRYIRE